MFARFRPAKPEHATHQCAGAGRHDDGNDGEDDRNAGGDRCAEHGDQDHERQRYADHLALDQRLFGQFVDFAADAAVVASAISATIGSTASVEPSSN